MPPPSWAFHSYQDFSCLNRLPTDYMLGTCTVKISVLQTLLHLYVKQYDRRGKRHNCVAIRVVLRGKVAVAISNSLNTWRKCIFMLHWSSCVCSPLASVSEAIGHKNHTLKGHIPAICLFPPTRNTNRCKSPGGEAFPRFSGKEIPCRPESHWTTQTPKDTQGLQSPLEKEAALKDTS